MYLGHIISEQGIKPDPEKIRAVKTFPTPKKAKDVKSFLGFAGYYRRFISDFAGITKPLTKLLKKNTEFIWDAHCDEAFRILKGKLITSPVLSYPDFKKEFLVTTDASDFAIGAVLSQGNIGEDRPICFSSRTLNNAETRYSTTEKELLAIIFAVKQFRPYIFGRQFTIVTDHRPLQWLLNLKDPTSRLARWRILLEEYDYKIIYKPGKYNVNADALSRIEKKEETNIKNILVTTRNQRKEMQAVPLMQQAKKVEKESIPYENVLVAQEERAESIFLDNKVKYKTLVLPLVESLEERSLMKLITRYKKPDVGNLEIFSPVDLLTTFIVTTVPFPFRNSADREVTLNSIKKIHSECIKLKITDLGISLPRFNNNSDHNELKAIFIQIFGTTNIKLHFFTNSRITLTSLDDIETVLREFHDSPFGGHQGVSRTLKRIKMKYFWPSMAKDVRKYIRKCDSCQRNKLQNVPAIPMKLTSTSSKPFERIALDVVGPLPVSYEDNKYLLTFQDDLTKYSEAYPLPNAEAKTIARIFVEQIICRHGSPDSVLTDRGTNFLSQLFQEVCKIMKIRKINTTPYHPQTNGALERSHRTLAEYLRHYTNRDPLTWDTWIPYALFVYNSTPHTSTGYAPHELLYGYPVNLPSVLRQKPNVSYNYDNYINELKSRLQHCHQVAREFAMSKKNQSKKYYDQGTKSKIFNVGDRVLVKNQTRQNKLSSLWEGPFEIVRIPSEENAVVKVRKKLKTLHNNDLKLFVE